MRLLTICLIAFLFASCDEPIWNAPKEAGQTPGPVKTYTVRNYAGGAVIKFTVPDANTSYVMATYEIGPGQKREAKASQFTDSLVVDGFGDAGAYDVMLYAVGVDEQRSAPLKVTVNPTLPPYRTAFSALQVAAGFGGVNIRTTNPAADNLVIETMVKTPAGKWEVYDRFYSNATAIKFNVRGLSDIPTEFAFYIRDRWAHYSDTLFAKLTPLKESKLSFNPYVNIKLPTDANLLSSSYTIAKLFDGVTTGSNQVDLLTARESGVPHHVTISLQKTYTLSRIKLFQAERVNYENFYNALSPRKFRIWGSMNPNPNGSFDSSWFLLGEFENIKPSGLPLGQLSAEDIQRALEGEDYEFDAATPPVKFLRYQILETWGNTTYMRTAEMEIYGLLVP